MASVLASLRSKLGRTTRAADVPVIINNFNRLSGLARLIEWLHRAGTRRIVVIDNRSDYEPLLAFYRTLGPRGVRVLRLAENVGSQALWARDLLTSLRRGSEYVYTDGDVVPAAGCPLDAIEHLQGVLRAHPTIQKVGLGLRIDNLPAQYRHRDAAVLWERQFWRQPAAPGLMFGHVDTTFALYRGGAGHAMDATNLRTTFPYVADHLGWHADSAHPTAEDAHYDRTARADVTSWTGDDLRADFAAGLPGLRTPRLMQIGGGGDAWPGWVQGDAMDLSREVAGSFDGFHLATAPESLALMQALHRLAKPNARLLAWAPDDFDPRRALSYGQPAHDGIETPYTGDWAISAIHRLTGRGTLIHLYAVKPARPRVGSLGVWSGPRDEATGLSPEPAFDVIG